MQIMQTDLVAGFPATGPREQKTDELAVAQASAVHWFAAYTNSHHEKRVAANLAERGLESFLPLYATLRRWKNRCQMNLELPLFANYVFVRIDPRERVRALEVPGVLSLVGFGRTLAPLPDFEIEALRCGLGRRKIEPHPYLVIGERVRIKRGAMMGMEGVLLRKKHNFRVVLALEAILQSVAVEVDAEDVEPAARPAGQALLPHGFSAPLNRPNQARRPL
ncbi:MAG: UpxY family transcription antiterminator [Terriglobales bacterium]